MANTRQMKLGFSIGSIGYHYAAWRLPEASPDGGLSGRHYIESALLAERRAKLTIRQLFDVISAGFWSLGVIGTHAKVADLMEEWFTTGAADGFNVQPPDLPGAGRDFVELVIPELQRRGLFRRQYEGRTLRENLGLPWVPKPLCRTASCSRRRRRRRDARDQATDEPRAVDHSSWLSLRRLAASRCAG
jgi:hypothetical protein